MDNGNMYGSNPGYGPQNGSGPANGPGYGPNPQNTNVFQSYAEPYREEPVSLGEWMIALLIMAIPCVNIIMMFVWAFSGNGKKSKSNYFKAALIWTGIGMALVLLLYIFLFAAALSAYRY